WPQSQIRRLLTNPFYVGRVVSKGLDLPGQHTPLVSTAVFERVGQLLQQRTRDVGTKGSVGGFPLRGVAICASCRGRMTAEQHGKWGYYRCSRQSYKKERCQAHFTRATKAHEDLKGLCVPLQITRSMAAAIRSCADQEIEARAATVDERTAQLR